MYDYKAKLHRVIDGDTIILDLDLGFDITKRVTVRLANIDTNEIHKVKKTSEEYQNGIEQKEFVEDLFESMKKMHSTIIFHSHEYNGKYGRAIGDIRFMAKYPMDNTELEISGISLVESILINFPHLTEKK